MTDLSTLPWSLAGRPNHWKMPGSMETGYGLNPEIGLVAARVPGSVQLALREAGLLPDWNQAENSRACEWVENRYWIFTTTIPDSWVADRGRITVEFAGLDYRGHVLLGPVEVGEFANSFVPHTFDLTDAVAAGHRTLAVARLGPAGAERPVAFAEDDTCFDLSPVAADIDGGFLATGLVLADGVADVQSLGLRLWVNGELRQDGSTKDMIFPVTELIWYLSQFMVLESGDVVNTGTPAGVALRMAEPRPYLRSGDVVELQIDGLGRQRQVLADA